MHIRQARKIALVVRSLPTTLRFNFAYFPLTQAIRLPVMCSHRVWLDRLGGTVQITGEIRTGMVRIGFGEVGIFDRERSRSIWRVEGRVIFEGSAKLGHGTRLSVDPTGTVVFGDDFVITAESAIVCRKAIRFGTSVLASWDVLIMDTDWHSVTDMDGTTLNPDRDIMIGNHVWIGCRSIILKGVSIPDGSIVAAGSIVTKGNLHANSMIAGAPASEVRTGISWS